MTEPTHHPAPVDLPGIDFGASVPCSVPECAAPPMWRYRLRCSIGGHPWIDLCDVHAQQKAREFEKVKRWECVSHRNPLPAGKPIEWRPL